MGLIRKAVLRRSIAGATLLVALSVPGAALAVDTPETIRNKAFAQFYGTGGNKAEAVTMFEQAATRGDVASMVFLGDAYEAGDGVVANRQTAIDWYVKAIAAGSQDAAARLAKLAAAPSAAPEPAATPKAAAAPEPEPEADAPDATALFNEGFALFDFDSKDNSEAVDILVEAADAGSTDAAGWLAYIYKNAVGLPKSDYVKARKYGLQAAEAGDAASMVVLAQLYGSGQGGKKSSKEYLFWMEKAAELDNVGALFQLGNAYFNGDLIKQDLKKAFDYQLRAADLGGADSNALIAFRYMYGDGTKKDYAKSAEYLFRAITFGSEWAQEELSSFAKNGTLMSHLQELLRKNGYYDGAVDGSMGKQTRAAIDAAFNTNPQ